MDTAYSTAPVGLISSKHGNSGLHTGFQVRPPSTVVISIWRSSQRFQQSPDRGPPLDGSRLTGRPPSRIARQRNPPNRTHPARSTGSDRFHAQPSRTPDPPANKDSRNPPVIWGWVPLQPPSLPCVLAGEPDQLCTSTSPRNDRQPASPVGIKPWQTGDHTVFIRQSNLQRLPGLPAVESSGRAHLQPDHSASSPVKRP